MRDNIYGYCNKYYNYANKFDPICWAGRFKPDWDAENRYFDIPVSHIHGKDTHDLSHYIANPKVHIPLIQSFTSKRKITSNEEITALADFKQIGGEFTGDINEFKSKISELQGSINQFKDLSGWIKGWTTFGKLI